MNFFQEKPKIDCPPRATSLNPVKSRPSTATKLNSENAFNKAISKKEAFSNVYDFSLIFIGISGSGKSCMINSIINYFEKRNVSNLVIASTTDTEKSTENRFILCNMARPNLKNIRCTEEIKFFQVISPENNKTYLLIDTPGLAETKATEIDEITLKTIINALNEIKNITSIIFVLKATTTRISPSIEISMKTFQDITRERPKISIFFALTFYAGGNLDFIDSLITFNHQAIFKMDNNIFSYKEELRLNSNKKLLGHWDKMKRKLQMFIEVINQERKKMVILNINEKLDKETKIIPKTTSENLEMKNQIQKPDERLNDYLKNINELLAKDPNLKPTSN